MNGRGCRRGRGGGAGSAHVCDRGCTVGGLSAAKIEILTVQAGGNYQYSAPTPGFSTFMILGQVGESSGGELVATPDSDTVAKSTATPEATSTSTKGTPGFGILVGIMGVLIAVYSRKK